MVAPNPVEAFLRHAEGDNDVHMVAIVFLLGVFQGGGVAVALGGVIIDQIGDAKDAASRRLDQLEAGRAVGPLPFAQRPNDVLDFFDLVLGAFARIDVRNVDDRFLGGVEHI